jgi:uncharacterized membrane protein
MLTNKRKAQLIILTTFILGVVAGASGQYLLSRQSLTSGPPQDLTGEMYRALRLDDNQRNQADQILKETRRRYQEIRTQVRPQFDAVREESRRQIRAMLSGEQQILFDKWNQEQDAKREQKAREEAAKNAK